MSEMDKEEDKCQIEGGGQEGPADGIVGSEDMTPTGEELMDKLKATEALLEQERQSRKESEDVHKKYAKLKRKYAEAKQMFRKKWRARKRMWRWMEAEMEALSREEERLAETMHGLKETLVKVSSEGGRKLEEIRGLARQVEELMNGKKNMPSSEKVAEAGVGVVMVERRDVALIFPEEVWRMILGNLSDPKDLWSLCITCQLFDKILSKWKTGWLLSQALPYLYKDLPGAKLLECRTICKSWREAVDNFLENHPSLFPVDGGDSSDPRRLDFIYPMREKKLGESYEISFSSSTDMTLFDVGKWTGSHIIGRYLILRLGRSYSDDDTVDLAAVSKNERADPEFGQMWNKFYEFLSTFATEVHSLSIFFYMNRRNGDAWEQKMLPFLTSDVLRIFPNLRKLQIQHQYGEFENVLVPNAVSLAAHKLETLGFNCWGGELGVAMLRKYHFQLRKLHLTAGTWVEVNTLNWPHLKELHLRQIFLTRDFQNLYGVRMPQLTKLGLDLGNLAVVDNVEYCASFGCLCTSIVRVIRELTSTTSLNSLRIEGGVRGLYIGEFHEDPYGTSKIKTLEFEHVTWDDIPDYGFLLRCFPLLENLNVFVKSHYRIYRDDAPLPETEMSLQTPSQFVEWMKNVFEASGHQEIVEVNKYLYDGGMYKSNIWELMPRLKVFSFQWDVYSRGGYEEYQAKRKKNWISTPALTPP